MSFNANKHHPDVLVDVLNEFYNSDKELISERVYALLMLVSEMRIHNILMDELIRATRFRPDGEW